MPFYSARNFQRAHASRQTPPMCCVKIASSRCIEANVKAQETRHEKESKPERLIGIITTSSTVVSSSSTTSTGVILLLLIRAIGGARHHRVLLLLLRPLIRCRCVNVRVPYAARKNRQCKHTFRGFVWTHHHREFRIGAELPPEKPPPPRPPPRPRPPPQPRPPPPPPP